MRLRPLFTRLAAAVAALGLVLLPSPVAHSAAGSVQYLALRYNLDRPDGNPFFCSSLGANGTLGTGWANVLGRVTSTAASTTVTEQVSGEGPFRDWVVNDVLKVQRGAPGPTTVDYAVITAKASAASITVDPAVSWANGTAGYNATARKTSCGQTAAFGWFSVGNWQDFTVVVQFQQGDLGGGLDWEVECKSGAEDENPTQVFPATPGTYQNIATAGTTVSASNALAGFERWTECRVGIRANTSDPSDAGANRERIHVTAIGTERLQ